MQQQCLMRENHCRARFQPCHFRCAIKEALAAGGWKACRCKHLGFVGKPTVETQAGKQAAEVIVNFVIPSEARNLSSVLAHDKKERFLASLGMTKRWESISAACEAAAHKAHPSDGL